MRIEVEVKYLAAVYEFAAEKDVRYYLKGVFIDPAGVLVATDGHAMGYAVRAVKFTEGEPAAAILPRENVAEVLKAAKALKAETVELVIAAGPVAVEGLRVAPFALIDGRFPDWRRMIPATVSGEYAPLDIALLQKAVRARIALGMMKREAGHVCIHQNGRGVHSIALDPQFRALIAPLRLSETTYDPLI